VSLLRPANNRYFDRRKSTKTFHSLYQNGKNRPYFNKNPKNLKHSAPQKKTCLPGEGKDREKPPCTRIGGYRFISRMWIARYGRWRPSSVLQASSGLFGQVGTSQFNGLARSALLE
jgi:hypothetical protein